MRYNIVSHLGLAFTMFQVLDVVIITTSQLGCQRGSMLTDLKSGGGVADAALGVDARRSDDLLPLSDLLTRADLPGGLSFESLVPYSVGAAWTVALGDINQDGKLDMMIGQVENNPQCIGIFLGKGDGTFQMPSYENLEPGAQPLAMLLGDFNNDGKLDSAVADITDGVDVLLGHGDGNFSPMQQYSIIGESLGLAAGDVNGDGKLDLVTATMSVLLGKGDGTFVVTTGATNALMYNVALIDLDGDGKLDAVGPTGTGVDVFLGQGDGGFTAAPPLALSGVNFAIAVGDFNGDSKPDIVSSTNGTIQLFLNLGDGTFGPPAAFDVVTDADEAFTGAKMAVADLNGDGHPDLAVINAGGVGVLLGDGAGSFSTPHYFAGQFGSSSRAIAVGDLNDDGRVDIVVSGQYFVEAFLNESQ